MSAFTINIDDKTYELTLPERKFDFSFNIVDRIAEGDIPLDFDFGEIAYRLCLNQRQIDNLVGYIVSITWTQEECYDINALIVDFDQTKIRCEDYLEDYVDWNEVWSDKVVDEIPKGNTDYEKDAFLQELVNIKNEAIKMRDEKWEQEQRQKNKAI